VVLAGATGLRVVSNIAVGYNNIDVAECTRRGILVTNTPGVLDDPPPTWPSRSCSRRRAAWWRRMPGPAPAIGTPAHAGWLGSDIHHARLGIFGMGRIGQAVARRAGGFDMEVVYHNRHRLPPEVEGACRARAVSRDELLATADFVMLTLPYCSDTTTTSARPSWQP